MNLAWQKYARPENYFSYEMMILAKKLAWKKRQRNNILWKRVFWNKEWRVKIIARDIKAFLETSKSLHKLILRHARYNWNKNDILEPQKEIFLDRWIVLLQREKCSSNKNTAEIAFFYSKQSVFFTRLVFLP